MESIRIALVGAGHIGGRYVEIFRRIPFVQLVAVCDADPLRKIDIQAQWQIPYYPDLTTLLQHVDADLYLVATPNGLHFPQALEILQAGKGVIVEKPLTLQGEQAQKLLDHAQKHRLPLFCILQNRSIPLLRWVKTHLGTPQLVYALLLWNRDSRYYFPGSWHGTRTLDGGALYTQFSHFIDTVQWLAGKITWQAASISNLAHPDIEIDDTGNLIFSTAQQAQGILAYTTTAWLKNFDTRLTLLYKDASLTLKGPYHAEIEKYEGRQALPEFDWGQQVSPHELFLREILTAYREGKWTYDTAYDALQNVLAIESAYQKAGWV
ncbi:MAG: Gfo/Idh/MocA family protein [Bacteroidia bacterium]